MATYVPEPFPKGAGRWTWPLFPLHRHAWDNLRVADSKTQPGQTIDVVRQRVRYRHLIDGGSEPFGTMRDVRTGYLPTPDDLAVVKCRFPTDDPNQPSWAGIEAVLVAAGNNPDDLRKLNAPTLIKLLEKAEDHKPAEPDHGGGKLVPESGRGNSATEQRDRVTSEANGDRSAWILNPGGFTEADGLPYIVNAASCLAQWNGSKAVAQRESSKGDYDAYAAAQRRAGRTDPTFWGPQYDRAAAAYLDIHDHLALNLRLMSVVARLLPETYKALAVVREFTIDPTGISDAHWRQAHNEWHAIYADSQAALEAVRHRPVGAGGGRKPKGRGPATNIDRWRVVDIARKFKKSSARVTQLCNKKKIKSWGVGKNRLVSYVSALSYFASRDKERSLRSDARLGQDSRADARAIEKDDRRS